MSSRPWLGLGGEVCEGQGALVSTPHASSRDSSIPSRPGPTQECGDSGASPGLGMGLSPSGAEVLPLTQEEGVGLTGGRGMATFVFRLPQGRPGRRQHPLIPVKRAQLSHSARQTWLQLHPASELFPDQPHGQEGRQPHTSCQTPAGPASWQEKAFRGHIPLQTPAVPEMRWSEQKQPRAWPGHGSASL